MLALLGLIVSIFGLMFLGGFFGYHMYKAVEWSKMVMKKLDRPIEIKRTGPTQGAYRPMNIVEDSKGSVVTPKSPQELEKQTMKELREQGYNVE
jgi:nitric oxide reductase large subunit